MWRPGRAELVGRRRAPRMRACDGRASRLAATNLISRASASRVLAERDDARDAGGLRARACSRSNCAIVAVEHRRAARLEPAKISALASAIASTDAEEFQMHRLDRGDDRDMRAHQLASAARSRRHGSCRSRTRRSARSAACAPATAARPSDCCRRRPRHASRRRATARARSASLVPVLPTEPVTAMIFARRARARGARRARAAPSSTSGTTSSGASVGERGALARGHDRQRRRRPCSAAVDEIVAVARVALDGEERVARLERAACRSKRRHAAGSAPRALARPSRRPSRRRSRAASLMRPAPRSAAATASWSENGKHPVADDLAGFMALAGDEQHVARLQARRPPSRIASRAVADLDARPARRPGSRRGSRPGPRCADCRR